jgi:DNA repair exonuclease SbcCD ATPase subunit
MEKLGDDGVTMLKKEMSKALGTEPVRDSPEDSVERRLRKDFKEERYQLQNEISSLRRKLDDGVTMLKAAEADLELARRQSDEISSLMAQVRTDLAQVQEQLRQGESQRNFKLKVRITVLEDQVVGLRAAAAQSAKDRDAEAVRQLKAQVTVLLAENAALRMAPVIPAETKSSSVPAKVEPKFADLNVQLKSVSGLQT